MTHPLPPLNAVRAFVAAARHQSITRAALDLHVTHGAISRQVKHLETHLGVSLFERRTRQVTLTAAGQRFFAEAQAALEQIGSAAQALMALAPTRAVRINVRPSFAVRWLIPRLPSFVLQHPGIEPQVVTSTRPPDASTGEFDVIIRRGLQGWPPALPVQAFMEDQLLVVGAPALFAAHPVDEPRALANLVLLSARTRDRDWDDWKKSLGQTRLKPASRLQFDHLHFVLQAAVDGLGFAMGPASLVAHDLASGRLVCPLPGLRLPLIRYYYGISADASAETHRFVQWLEKEQHRPIPSGLAG